ncbi:transposase family protein [Candidatus Poriferisodalis sp.]|uniref:transposase family protein n=1 Tax=Candidatus Poriferisodalis sp. TaxID=3101277 RepID=UPI003B02A2C9
MGRGPAGIGFWRRRTLEGLDGEWCCVGAVVAAAGQGARGAGRRVRGLVVGVCSTATRPVCSDCGERSGRVHDRRAKRVRDLGVSGGPATLMWGRRRMDCDGCGRRFLEDHPALEGRVAARVARRLAADARDMSVSAVARRHRVGWHAVTALAVAYAGLVGDHRRRRRCGVLWADETSVRERRRHVTVLVNGDTAKTLAVVAHRSEAALSGFPAAQGHRRQKGVKSERRGTRSASCAASVSRTTATAPSKRSTASRTSTAPGRSSTGAWEPGVASASER